MSTLTQAPILEENESNKAEVLAAVAAMILGRSGTVMHVEVKVAERRPGGELQWHILSGRVTA